MIGLLPVFLLSETLPVTNSPENKHICETGSTGCCEKNSIANVRNCTSFNLYFHRTSKGCDKDYCFGMYFNRNLSTKTNWKRSIQYCKVCFDLPMVHNAFWDS